jgi:hypothetical protein
MRELPTNTNHAIIRQLIADQRERRRYSDALNYQERLGYVTAAVAHAKQIVGIKNIDIDAVQFAAHYTTALLGKPVAVEEFCQLLGRFADELIENGNYSRANINALYFAFQARLN